MRAALSHPWRPPPDPTTSFCAAKKKSHAVLIVWKETSALGSLGSEQMPRSTNPTQEALRVPSLSDRISEGADGRSALPSPSAVTRASVT